MLGGNLLSMSALSLYRNVVQFGMSMALTAFIAPADYGLVVFTLPFLALIAMLTDLGLSSAITRAPTLDREQAGAALTLMTAAGMVFALLLGLGGYPLSLAIAMPGLGGIMAGMALVVVLTVTATTPRALLERRLQYGRIAVIEAAAVFVSAGIGLFAAWRGAGASSLVIYNFVNNAIRAAAFLWLARGDLEWNTRWRSLGALISFGGWVLASNLLNFLARNSDNLLIGAYLGAAAVGLYGLSYQFMLAPLMAITWPASAILLATLRQEANHPARAAQMLEAVLGATAMIAFPAMVFLCFGLTFPVTALLSPRWQAVPEIVAWLAPIGALQSVSSYNGAVLLVAGHARTQFWFTIFNTVLLVATFVIALPFGLMMLVRAYAVAAAFSSIVQLALIVRYSAMRWSDLAATLTPAVIATLAGVGAVTAVIGLHANSWLLWFAMAGLYGVIVLGCYAFLARRLRPRFAILIARSPAQGVAA